MEQISSREALARWLADKPREWAQVMAARAALRALPVVLADEDDASSKLAIFRATAIAWAARNYPAHDMVGAADAAAGAAAGADAYAAAYAAASAVDAVNAVDAAFAAADAVDAVDAAAYAAAYAAYAVDAAGYAVTDAYWAEVQQDGLWFTQQDTPPAASAQHLTKRALWAGAQPETFKQSWPDGAKRLPDQAPGFAPWIEWFERRIRGEDAAFDIPGDADREEDKAILRKLADASNEDFWDKGPEYVNTALQQWLGEARQRAAENLEQKRAAIDLAAIRKKLEAAASPQGRIIDGKLDAGPNETFDQPDYSGDLANLPAELLAFLNVLSSSLGLQASPFMQSSLTEYRNEILVRGNRPIVGILKGLASAIGRELWTQESALKSDDPGDWDMKDEREWGSGLADMFRTFFKYHHNLITHFPLDDEREKTLRTTLIDENAASGGALTGPIELVTQLIGDLHKQGAATDDILKIINAHAQYNANIASLPPPAGITPPPDYVSPKRRHVLMTAGFYQNLYNALGSSASITSLAVTPGLLVQLQVAVDALLKFIL